MARKRLITVEEGILAHLLGFMKVEPGETVPMGMTQAGISLALGVRRSHVSLSLDAAMGRGTVEEHLSRVKGERRKRKCYFLTPAGIGQARDIEGGISAAKVTARLRDGTDYRGSLGGLVSLLGPGACLPALALLCEGGRLELPEAPGAAQEVAQHWKVPEVADLIGRERELESLRGLYARTVQVAVITGMPGIGKTALAARAAATFGDGRVFWWGVREWSSPGNTTMHLSRFFQGLGQDRLRRYMETHESPEIADIHDILLGVQAEAVLVFDDCHRASAQMIAFLDMLAAVCRANRSLAVCLVGRQVAVSASGGETLRLQVGPLDEMSSISLLERRGFSGDAALAMAERCGGHPMYLATVGSGGGKQTADDIEAAVALEIDSTLTGQERALLQSLSVFREPVPRDAIVEAQADIDAVERLAARGIVSWNGSVSMHGILKDFYYSRQAPADRRARHERAAEFYTRRPGGPTDRVEEVFHLLMAEDYETAILALAHSGPRLLAGGHVDDVLELCRLVPGAWRRENESYELNEIEGSAHDLLGNWQAARESFSACLEISEELGDGDRAADALLRLGAIRYRLGELAAARALLVKGLGKATHPLTLAELHGSLGVVLWRMGEPDAARKEHRTDLEMSRDSNDPRGMARALNNLGILDWEAGDHSTALEMYAEALAHAGRISDSRLVAIIYSNIGDVHRTMGQPAEAKRYYERCLELAEDLKFNWQVAEAHRGLAEVVPGKRREYLARALAIFERLGASEDAKTVREMMQ